MATLNVGMKINGGGTINITGAGTTTVFTNAANEYAEVSMYISGTAATLGTSSVSVQVGGVVIASTSATGTLSTTASSVVGHTINSSSGSVSDKSGQMLRFIVPPSASLVIVRVQSAGSSSIARGSYYRIINTQ